MNKVLSTDGHWDGLIYSQISKPQYRTNIEFLEKFVFSDHEIGLDIGCGEGRTTREIAKKIQNGKIIGIDISNSMLEAAISRSNAKNIEFKLESVLQMDYFEKFDFCTSFFCLQWVPEKMQAFRKIYRALKPKGRFLAIIPLPHRHLPVIRQKMMQEDKWSKYFTNFDDPLVYINDSDYAGYASCSGFKIDSLLEEEVSFQFLKYNQFFDFMREMTPHIKVLQNSEEKDKFIHQLIEEYTKFYPATEDGVYTLIYRLAKIYLSKEAIL